MAHFKHERASLKHTHTIFPLQDGHTNEYQHISVNIADMCLF